jgi:hypothetical protein
MVRLRGKRLGRLRGYLWALLQWFERNLFWLLAIGTGSLTLIAASKEEFLAAFAFLLVCFVCVGAGIYFANVAFTREILTEYDRILQSQLKRRSFKIIRGGKDK